VRVWGVDSLGNWGAECPTLVGLDLAELASAAQNSCRIASAESPDCRGFDAFKEIGVLVAEIKSGTIAFVGKIPEREAFDGLIPDRCFSQFDQLLALTSGRVLGPARHVFQEVELPVRPLNILEFEQERCQVSHALRILLQGVDFAIVGHGWRAVGSLWETLWKRSRTRATLSDSKMGCTLPLAT
jgi:hypothetical protein